MTKHATGIMTVSRSGHGVRGPVRGLEMWWWTGHIDSAEGMCFLPSDPGLSPAHVSEKLRKFFSLLFFFFHFYSFASSVIIGGLVPVQSHSYFSSLSYCSKVRDKR